MKGNSLLPFRFSFFVRLLRQCIWDAFGAMINGGWILTTIVGNESYCFLYPFPIFSCHFNLIWSTFTSLSVVFFSSSFNIIFLFGFLISLWGHVETKVLQIFKPIITEMKLPYQDREKEWDGDKSVEYRRKKKIRVGRAFLKANWSRLWTCWDFSIILILKLFYRIGIKGEPKGGSLRK